MRVSRRCMGTGIAVLVSTRRLFCVCMELKKSSSLTVVAELQKFVGFFLLLGTFCSCWWLKGGQLPHKYSRKYLR